jgi:hypothetical protein
VLVESDVIGQGSVVGAMKGKHYNRSVYCHKVASEALHRLRFETSINCLGQQECEDIKAVAQDLLTNFSSGILEREITDENFIELMTTYQTFIMVECEKNATFAFWSSYLEMVEILLCFIR